MGRSGSGSKLMLHGCRNHSLHAVHCCSLSCTAKQLCSQGCIPIEPKLYHFSVQGVQSLGPAQRHREPCGRVVRCSPGTLHKAPAPLALCTRHPTTWPAECSPHLFNMSSAMPLSIFASTCMACGKEECPSLLSYCSLQVDRSVTQC